MFIKTRDFFSLMFFINYFSSTTSLNFIIRCDVKMYIYDKSTTKMKHVFWIALISLNVPSSIFMQLINFNVFTRRITSPSLFIMRHIINICICRELTTWRRSRIWLFAYNAQYSLFDIRENLELFLICDRDVFNFESCYANRDQNRYML